MNYRPRLRKDILVKRWWKECKATGHQLYPMFHGEPAEPFIRHFPDSKPSDWLKIVATDLLWAAFHKWMEHKHPESLEFYNKKGFLMMFHRHVRVKKARITVDKKLMSAVKFQRREDY